MPPTSGTKLGLAALALLSVAWLPVGCAVSAQAKLKGATAAVHEVPARRGSFGSMVARFPTESATGTAVRSGPPEVTMAGAASGCVQLLTTMSALVAGLRFPAASVTTSCTV